MAMVLARDVIQVRLEKEFVAIPSNQVQDRHTKVLSNLSTGMIASDLSLVLMAHTCNT